MLYGSYARGTQTGESDIDILQLVGRRPKSFNIGRINVTQYTPSSLKNMAREGSLFVLHLRTEGRVIEDARNILQNALMQYRQPKNYLGIKDELSIAAAALNPSLIDSSSYLQSLARLGVYILRTATYIRCIEDGVPIFDLNEVAAHLKDPELKLVIDERRTDTFKPEDLLRCEKVLRKYLPTAEFSNPPSSVEELAVHYAKGRHSSALLAYVMSGDTTIDYTMLTLPPI